MKKIMMRAWEIYRELTGDHKAKIAYALRQAWAEAKASTATMSREEIIDELTKKFGRWTKKGYNGKVLDRIYFNATDLGLTVTYYKTGSVSSAEINGERISNCEARRVLGSKAYFDLTDNTLHMDSTMERYFGDKISAEVAALIA